MTRSNEVHKPIKQFTKEGHIRDDSDFIRIREQMEKITVEEMRDYGYLPVIDIGSLWTTHREDKLYAFTLTLYGVYVGKKKAKEYSYWSAGKLSKNG